MPGGSLVFQTTFLLGPNLSGRPVVSETPSPLGPRNRGQSLAAAMLMTVSVNDTKMKADQTDFWLIEFVPIYRGL